MCWLLAAILYLHIHYVFNISMSLLQSSAELTKYLNRSGNYASVIANMKDEFNRFHFRDPEKNAKLLSKTSHIDKHDGFFKNYPELLEEDSWERKGIPLSEELQDIERNGIVFPDFE